MDFLRESPTFLVNEEFNLFNLSKNLEINIKDKDEHEFFFQSLPMKEVELLYCGYQRCQPGHWYGPMMRDHFYYHYIVSGKGIVRSNNMEFQVNADSGFIGYPNQIIYYEADMQDPWTYIWVGAKGSAFPALISEAGLSNQMPVIHLKHAEQVFHTICSIIDCAQDSSPPSLLNATGLFFLLFSELSESSDSMPLPNNRLKLSTKDYLDKATQFIQKNYSKKIGVQTIAEYIGIDESYLARMFKEEYSTTPVRFLRNYRINISHKLLLHTTMSVKQIAMSVGFEDPQYFSRCFTQQRGVSPEAIRKENKIQ